MSECTREGKELQYNYIYMNIHSDFYNDILSDLQKEPQVELRDFAIAKPNMVKNLLFKLHWSAKINSIISLPLKRLWYREMAENSFQNNKPVCYIFMAGQYILNNPALYQYIHRLDPRNRCVAQYGDLISKHHSIEEFEKVKNNVDINITYDKGEAEKFGIYYQEIRSYSRTEEYNEPDEFDYDLYFLGNVKDRLTRIMEIYRQAVQAGLRCKFLLAGVPKDQQGSYEGISYIHQIPYKENISYVKKSKCILEVAQGNSVNNTLRLDEAIAYHRKLLTDCTLFQGGKYYIPETMQIFPDVEGINWDFIRQPIPYHIFHERSISLSPLNYLYFLDDLLTSLRDGKVDKDRME